MMSLNLTVTRAKQVFSSKSNLKMHMNSKHQKQFIHNCDKYGYGTNNRQAMTSHKIREHTSKEDSQQLEKFKCSICSKEFVTKQLLQKHFYSANCGVVHDPGSHNCAIIVLYTESIVLSSTSRV